MCAKRIISFLILIFAIEKTSAQFILPRFDVEAKISQSIIPAGGKNESTSYPLKALETTNLSLGAHVQINQYFAVGWIYSTSLRGNGYNNKDFKFNIGGGDTKASSMMSGLDIRVSAGRARRTRPYLSLNYCKVELVEDRGSFRLADKTSAIGGSIGLMKRLGSRLYLNLFELSARKYADRIYWSSGSDVGNIILEIKTGLTYNIGKKK